MGFWGNVEKYWRLSRGERPKESDEPRTKPWIDAEASLMRPVRYSCPFTGRRVQALVDESDIIKWKTLLIDCSICNRPHIVSVEDIEHIKG